MVFREVASRAKLDRAQLRRLLETSPTPATVVMVTRFDRLAGRPRDMLNMFAAITAKEPGFSPATPRATRARLTVA